MGNKSPSKVEPMDNRDLTSALLKLIDRVEKLEAPSKEDDIKSAGRFRAYKEEIREMLSKHSDERAAQRKDFEEHFNTVGQHVNMMLPGLNRLENRVNAIWNTFNAFVRYMEQLWLKPSNAPSLPHTREEFNTGFMEAGKEVFQEHKDHEKAELDRLRQEKKEHGVALSPAKPQSDSTDSVMLEMNTLVVNHVQSNREDIKERMNLDLEARKKLSEALIDKKLVEP